MAALATAAGAVATVGSGTGAVAVTAIGRAVAGADAGAFAWSSNTDHSSFPEILNLPKESSLFRAPGPAGDRLPPSPPSNDALDCTLVLEEV